MFTLTPALLFEVQVKQETLSTPFKSYSHSTSGRLHSLPPFPLDLSGTIQHSNALLTSTSPSTPAHLKITGLALLSSGTHITYTISGKYGLCGEMAPITSGRGTGDEFPPVRFGQTVSALTVRFEVGGGPGELSVLEENVFVASASMACGEVEGEFTMAIMVGMVGVEGSEWSAVDHPECRGSRV